MTNATWDRGVQNGVHEMRVFHAGDKVQIHPDYFSTGLSTAYTDRGSDFIYTVYEVFGNCLCLKEETGFWNNPCAELIPACLPPEDEFDSNSLFDLL